MSSGNVIHDICRDHSDVWIEIESGLETRRPVFCFGYGCDSQETAELLRWHIQKVIGDRIARVREEEYNEGWKDAKAKPAKRTRFSRWL
jgi:hypothetical protein